MTRTNRIDLMVVVDILNACAEEITDLNGRPFSDSGKSDAQLAATSRKLNHLADMLTLAGSLVRNEYWVGKGFDDPTTE